MNKNKLTSIFAIFSFSFLAMGLGITSPALASISQAFPGIDFSIIVLIATLPALLMVPFSMVGGKLAGNVMTYKNVTLLGIILFIIGGTAPYFMSNFTAILFMRCVFGAGAGLMSPIPAALIIRLFQGKEVEDLMGYNGVIQNIGGIVFSLLGGVICAINWRDTFLAHLLAIIPFVVVIFLLPEPTKTESIKGEKVKMPGMVYVWSIIFLVYELLLYPMLVGMSSLILVNKLGTAASAGVILTMFTVGGMASGAVFGKVYRVATRFTFVLGLIINAVGYVLLIYGDSLMIFTVAATIVGIGFGFIFTAILMSVGMLVPQSATAFAISIAVAFMSLGGFLSSFFFAFVQNMFNITSMRFPYVLGAICMGGYAVIHALFNLKPTNTQGPSVPGGPKDL